MRKMRNKRFYKRKERDNSIDYEDKKMVDIQYTIRLENSEKVMLVSYQEYKWASKLKWYEIKEGGAMSDSFETVEENLKSLIGRKGKAIHKDGNKLNNCQSNIEIVDGRTTYEFYIDTKMYSEELVM